MSHFSKLINLGNFIESDKVFTNYLFIKIQPLDTIITIINIVSKLRIYYARVYYRYRVLTTGN